MLRSLKSQQLCDRKRLSALCSRGSTVEAAMLSFSCSHPWEATRGGFCDSCSLVLSLSPSREDATQLLSFLSAFSDPGKPATLTWALSAVSWEFVESRRPNLRQQPGSPPCTFALSCIRLQVFSPEFSAVPERTHSEVSDPPCELTLSATTWLKDRVDGPGLGTKRVWAIFNSPSSPNPSTF